MKRLLLLAVMLSVLGSQLTAAHGQLTEVTKGGMTVKLLENTDHCEEDCYSVYQVCGTTVSKSDVSLDYKTDSKTTATVLDEKITVTLEKGCYNVRVEGKKGKFANVDNIPTFKGYEFPEFAWWNSTWKYRQAIDVNVSDGSTLTDYQVYMNVTWDPHMKDDLSDVRFTNNCSDDAEEIAYCMGSECMADSSTDAGGYTVPVIVNQSHADTWVLVPTINSTICAYWNNSDATYEGNPISVFDLFDDFEDDSKNTTIWSGCGADWSETGGQLVGTHGAGWEYCVSSFEIPLGSPSIMIETLAKGTSHTQMTNFYNSGCNSGQFYPMYANPGTNKINWGGTDLGAWSAGTWYFTRNAFLFPDDLFATSNASKSYNTSTQTCYNDFNLSLNIYGSTGTWEWIRARHIHVPEPTTSNYTLEQYDVGAPSATLISPPDASYDTDYSIDFNCTANDNNDLDYIRLYMEGAGLDWHLNETVAASGTWDFNVFSKTFTDPWVDEVITWNCQAEDNEALTGFAPVNRTVILQSMDTAEEYESEADETDTVEMILTVAAYSDKIQGVEASLFYDGVNVSYDTKDTTGESYNNYTFTATAIPDLVEVDGTNVSFNWVYVITYINDTAQEFNTTELNQTIDWAYYPTSADSDPVAVTEGQNVTITVYTYQELSVATVNVSVWFNDEEYPDTDKSGTDYSREISTSGINTTVYYNGSMNISYNGISFLRNTTSYSLTVAEIILTNCSAASESQTVALEFWIYDEDTLGDLTSDLAVSFDVWSDPSNVVSWSFDFSGDNNYSVCIYPTDATYTIDMMSQYEATGYSPRTYYLNDASISNSSQTIDLYLGSNASQDLITMQVLSSLGLPQEDAYINIAEYNIGAGTYTTVAIVNTDYDGKAYTYLTKETKWYRFTVYGDDIDTELFGPLVIVDDSLTFQLSGGQYGEWLEYYGQLTGGCTFPSNTTTCTATDTSGLMASARLIVKRWTSLGYIDVCDTTDTGSSVTIVCDLGSTSGRIYWYDFSATFQNTHQTIDSGYLDYSSPGTDYGDLGLIASVILILFLAFIGSWRWEVGLAGSGIGFGMGWAMGLTAMSWSSVVTVFVIIAIAIYKGRTT